ncbi:MAG: carbon storage regulator CsrA [Treponema sp.]|nr:carbon storage regulator CsrA [Treponema sp.]
MLILSRKVDEKIKIGSDITITIIEVHGDQVKVGVEAPKNVKVFRQEVFEAIQSENRQAAAAPQGTQDDVLKLLATKLK